MNRSAIVAVTAVAAIAAFAGGAAYYGRKDAPAAPVPASAPAPAPAPAAAAAPAAPAVATPTVAPAADTLIRPHSPIIGRADAPVTIVEFFDPSCEACRAFYPLVKQIHEANPETVRVVLRYTPLHQGSDEAVRILEAARLQDKFVPVLEAILERQPEWAMHGAPDLDKAWTIAGEAGLDVARGRRDGATPAVDAVLKQDMADIEANKVQQTPTFFVNGKQLTEFGPQQLNDAVMDEVRALKAAP